MALHKKTFFATHKSNQTPIEMAHATARSMTKMLKRNAKKLFSALAAPTQALKSTAKKPDRTSKSAAIPAPAPVVALADHSNSPTLTPHATLRNSLPLSPNVSNYTRDEPELGDGCLEDTENNATEAALDISIDNEASCPASIDVDDTSKATSDPPIAAISHEDSIAILTGSELAHQLRTAVMEHRSLKALELDCDLELTSLDDQSETLAQQIRSLQDVVQALRSGPDSPEQTAEVNALYDAINNLRDAEKANHQRGLGVVRRMSEFYQDFRNAQCPLLDNLDAMFVEKDHIPSEGQSDSVGSRDSVGSSSRTKDEPEHTLRHSKASIATARRLTDDNEQAAIEAKTRAAIHDDYIVKRKHLGACELRFDTRGDRFDALDERRQQQLSAGEKIQTETEFDHYVFDETRQLTRKLIDAEAEYEVAKAAAVAAGIQLRYSDIESGFVDDVNDGYRISMERDMVEECDREWIEDWLDEIQESISPNRYLSVRESEELDWEGVVGEGMNQEEVGISDSVSMVAEGPARKRIDKWAAQMAALLWNLAVYQPSSLHIS